MNCASCDTEMETGALYVRGLGSSLSWSNRKDVGAFSKKGLSIIDLGKISLTPIGAQAVVESWRCTACGMIMFKDGAKPE